MMPSATSAVRYAVSWVVTDDSVGTLGVGESAVPDGKSDGSKN